MPGKPFTIEQIADDRFLMKDFEATVVAQDAIRIDIYDEFNIAETLGRYTKNYSKCELMAVVILCIRAIERCDVIEAQGAKAKGKK
jgi:hypothetical protein